MFDLNKLKKIAVKTLVLLSVFSVFSISQHILAEEFPDRPVSLVVSYSPGGATDFQARIVTIFINLLLRGRTSV